MKFEDVFGMGGFGYLAMVVVNVRKMKYVILKGFFDNIGIDEFLRIVLVGRGSIFFIVGGNLFIVEEIVLWDGKDGELLEEEDIDLLDVDLDEDED